MNTYNDIVPTHSAQFVPMLDSSKLKKKKKQTRFPSNWTSLNIHPLVLVLFLGTIQMFQPWVFFGRNDAKAETPVFWPPHAKSWLIGKDSDAGRDWGQEEKGTTEDEIAGWHHRLDGREFEWPSGVGDGQGGLAHCNSWGHKESDTTERLNWTELNTDVYSFCHWVELHIFGE